MPSSRRSSQPGAWTQVSCIADSSPTEPPGKPIPLQRYSIFCLPNQLMGMRVFTFGYYAWFCFEYSWLLLCAHIFSLFMDIYQWKLLDHVLLYITISSVWGFHFITSSAILFIIQVFIIAILVGMKVVPSCDFDSHFLMAKDVGYILCLFAICVSSWERSVQILCPFLFGLFTSILLNGKNSLHNLGLYLWFQIFSLILWIVFSHSWFRLIEA